MKPIGETLKIIRTGKKVTQAALSRDIMSVSFYNRVENGKSSVTIELFMALLDRLNVTFFEFIFISNGYADAPDDYIWDNIYNASTKNKVGELQAIIAELDQELEEKENTRFLAYKLIAAFSYANLTQTDPAEEDREQLHQMLFSVDSWTKFEVSIFISTMEFINLDLVLLYAKKLLEYTSLYSNSSLYGNVASNALINLILILFKNNRTNDAFYYLSVLNSQKINPKFLYQRNMIKFLNGLQLIEIGNIAKGMEETTNALNIYESFDLQATADELKTYRAHSLKKQQKED